MESSDLGWAPRSNKYPPNPPAKSSTQQHSKTQTHSTSPIKSPDQSHHLAANVPAKKMPRVRKPRTRRFYNSRHQSTRQACQYHLEGHPQGEVCPDIHRTVDKYCIECHAPRHEGTECEEWTEEKGAESGAVWGEGLEWFRYEG